MTLCKRGKAAAKAKFKTYPSAYANAYAARVCKGEIAGADGKKCADAAYMRALKKKKQSGKSSELQRWFRERWVDVCRGPPPYPPCGRSKGASTKDWRKKYPYCRPMRRVNKKTPKTVDEIGPKKIKQMCARKRKSMRTHKGKSPTRVSLKSKRRLVL